MRQEKLQVKSEETIRSERQIKSFKAQISRLSREITLVEKEQENYNQLKLLVDAFMSGELQVDLKNPEHTRTVAFLKKHVSLLQIYQLTAP